MVSDEMRAEVERLKAEQDAVILAHYYVTPEAQELADYVGDSFFLSKLAATLDCKTLVFAGVRFMAESAKLLSPNKRVLMPEPSADCPMAHMMRRETIDQARATYGDDLAVACYVNSTTQMKALSDVCVTSSNAVRIVRALPQPHVLFIPDQHLGHYVSEQVSEKNVILNDGFCPTHEAIEVVEVEALQERYPHAVTLAHPECGSWVLEKADFVGSTSQMIEAAVSSDATDFIVLTVHGVLSELERRCAGTGKRFHFPATTPICPNMARVSGEKVRSCLADGTGEVDLPPDDVAERARAALSRMLELAR
ncbi:quinolinate synthase NadA [Thermophilibacter immobilis]|uniref:Quinolinate synthase n=1 Tax=Thermophilibacter immobilis TaxID=2779519 RepID=A0A7S7M7W6_9ACTN|nr:quinolinate synthase NadA [Thermophilibacter immobilis]QOY60329.1 quinolinate synthase NadA [Thermophilibacter immobilis]